MSGFMLPIRTRDQQHFILFVALDDEALGRVQEHDPFDMRLSRIKAMEPWRSLELQEVVIGYVNPVDLLEVQQMQARGASGSEVVLYLSRGRRFMPDRGDGGEVRRLGEAG